MKHKKVLFGILLLAVHSGFGQSPSSDKGINIPTLLEEAMKNQRTQDGSLAEYTANFKTTLRIPSWWRGKIEDISTGETFQSWRRNLDVILTHNGAPLSPEKVEKERELGAKALQSDIESRSERAADQKVNGVEYGSQRGSFYMSVYSIFRNSEFTNLRKDLLNGREMLALDFSPRPNFKSHDTSDAPLAHLKGTVWIDAKDKITAKIIALIAPPTNGDQVVFEQRFSRMPDGIWLCTYLHMNPSIQPKFFNGENFDWTREKSNYQRFTVMTQ